jgi:uncharacterized protein YyaL (SSP411 family)
MAFIRVLVIAVICVAFWGNCRAFAAELAWGKDLSAGLHSAKTSNKWVLVDVSTSWCGWCKKLDREVYTDPSVIQALNKSFVLVKVNGDDPQLGKYVAKHYGVNGYPTIIVLAPSGQMKGKFDGYCPSNEFLQKVSRIVSQ